jgi:hypothetical protein
MVGITGFDDTNLGCRRGLGGFGRPLLPDSPHGVLGDLPTRAGQGLSNPAISSEAGEVHRVNELSNHVGIATDGRLGLDERAYRLPFGMIVGFLLPAGDGA